MKTIKKDVFLILPFEYINLGIKDVIKYGLSIKLTYNNKTVEKVFDKLNSQIIF